MREWVKQRNPWCGELISCFYCFNHWAALALVGWATEEPLGQKILTVLAVTALASLISGQIISYFNGVKQSEEVKELHEEIEQLQGALLVAQDALQKKKR
jgi:hypothetical protein